MEIKDLQARMGNVDVIVTIIDKGPVREFEKFGKKGRVCTALAQDETSTINLTLWNDDIDKVEAGYKIQIKNGYVGEYQGELQLSTGKFGEIIVLEKGEKPTKLSQPSKPNRQKPTTKEPEEQPFEKEESVSNSNDEEEEF